MTAAAAEKAPAKRRVPYFSTEATVDVDIDPDDLHAAGWHHEHECPAEPLQLVRDEEDDPAPAVTFPEAVASLHRQAHPGQGPSVATCHEEPCRSLTLDQLRGKHRPSIW